MGGVFSGGAKRKSVKVGGEENNNSGINTSWKLRSLHSTGKKRENSYRNNNGDDFGRTTPQRSNSGEFLSSFSRELKPSTPARTEADKINQKKSFLGKAGTVGLEKAVEVLDTLGSSMSNLNPKGGFATGMGSRGNRISILAFEVANTIAKGANLFHSLSEENVESLKKEVLHSEGVHKLVCTDMEELLIIAAADKREEFDVFSREVIRFGDLCKDPQWHNLGRYFSKLDSEYSFERQHRTEAEATMQELITLVQNTSELYHELNALDRFEQDYRQKVEEVQSLNLSVKGESLTILHSELKQQRKLVRSLKKKSLWSKNVEEIMEKLVDIVTYLQQAILEAFGNNGVILADKEPGNSRQRLGTSGLALHYANLINQIDNITSRPTCLPPNTRDSLYRGIPDSVKAALRSRLQMVDTKEELTIALVKAEMEKTLHWLAPIATNTTKAHQGFGWVGEWANTGNEFGKNTAGNSNLIRLQTLHHADKQKTDLYILELVTWLHRLINLVRQRDHGFKSMHVRSPSRKGPVFHTMTPRLQSLNHGAQLSQEDRDLLANLCQRRSVLGRSKSQEFLGDKKRRQVWTLSRSTGNSPVAARQKLEHRKTNILNVMDGLNDI
ncbi:protein PSK SIMULATOR 2-like isoform X1 [Populus alba x Populus x berolinensis]|nr:protein PSK SIMULATOR 2-like isoform X1 [Populus alba x Populus x berolinensis]